MILNDKDLIRFVPMINPFIPEQVKEINGKKIVSYGLSSFGYDIRLSEEFMRPIASKGIVSPINPPDYEAWNAKAIIIMPGTTVLGKSLEYFTIPEHVMAISTGKSTYNRLGLVVNCSPMEPGWEGFYTIAMSNMGQQAIQVFANQGITQMVFFLGERPDVTYADRQGKYQNAAGIETAKL